MSDYKHSYIYICVVEIFLFFSHRHEVHLEMMEKNPTWTGLWKQEQKKKKSHYDVMHYYKRHMCA